MKPILSDEIWEAVRPHLPLRTSGRRTRAGGRPSVDDRTVLTGILYVLRTRTAWMMLPTELGYGSGITCWRRLREWQGAGVWPRVQEILQARLDEPQAFDWGRACTPAPAPQAQPAPVAMAMERAASRAAQWCSVL